MEAMRAQIAQLEAMMALQQRHAALSAQLAVGAAASPSPQPGAPAVLTVVERRALAVSAPPRLTILRASESGALDEWLFEIGQYFQQLGLADDNQRRVGEALLAMDHDLNRWWSAHAEQLAKDGKPLARWAEFAAALKKQYTSPADARVAREAFLKIRQHSSESMMEFANRAHKLFLRALPMDERMAVELVVTHMRQEEWPYTTIAVKRALDSVEGITSMAQLRAKLQMESMLEPRQRGGGAQVGASSASQQRSGGGPKKRAAAVGTDQGDSDTAGEPDAAPGGAPNIHAAAVRPYGDNCARCKKPGHVVADCTAKDDRLCYYCQRSGHLIRECPDKKAGRPRVPKN